MTDKVEYEVSWVGKLWYDMELDGMKSFVTRNINRSKIDQLLDFYWIPYIYKNEYKRYLKYRIQERHRPVVQDYFERVLASEWYDHDYISSRKFWEIQMEYIKNNPDPEQTWLDIKVNYNAFMQKEQESKEAKSMSQYMTKEEWQNMMVMMADMMKEMKSITKTIWSLSPTIIDNGNTNWTSASQLSSWSTQQNEKQTWAFATEVLWQSSDSWGSWGTMEHAPSETDPNDWWDGWISHNTFEPIKIDGDELKWLSEWSDWE